MQHNFQSKFIYDYGILKSVQFVSSIWITWKEAYYSTQLLLFTQRPSNRSVTNFRYGDSTYQSRYGSGTKEEAPSSYTRRTAPEEPDVTPTSRYGAGGFQSRFLNKSKSTAAVSPEDEVPERKFSSAGTEDSRYPSGRSRYSALKVSSRGWSIRKCSMCRHHENMRRQRKKLLTVGTEEILHHGWNSVY